MLVAVTRMGHCRSELWNLICISTILQSSGEADFVSCLLLCGM
jgi:hypothetical protein